jgi:hypothetical protein
MGAYNASAIEQGKFAFTDFFNNVNMICHFFLAIGTAMLSIGFYKNPQNNSDKLALDSSKKSIALGAPDGRIIYEKKFEDLSSLIMTKDPGGPETPDRFDIFIILKNSAVFWAGGFHSKGKKAKMLSDTISKHTSLKLETLITDHIQEVISSIDEGYISDNNINVTENDTAFGREYRLNWNRISVKRSFLGIIILSFFAMAPLYIFGISKGVDSAGIFRVFAVFFSMAWYAVMLMMLLINCKDYRLKINDAELIVDITAGALPIKIFSTRIPLKSMACATINRLRSGSFALGICLQRQDKTFRLPGMLKALGSLAKGQPFMHLLGKLNSFLLWEVHQSYPSRGTRNLNDLMHIEKAINSAIQLKR